MYVPSEYSDFKYIISYSDNYVVLTDRRNVNASFDAPTTIDVFIQYFYPSTISFTSSQTFRSSQTFQTIDVGSSFYDRSDCPILLLSIFSCIVFICCIYNVLTKLFVKGGIFNVE